MPKQSNVAKFPGSQSPGIGVREIATGIMNQIDDIRHIVVGVQFKKGGTVVAISKQTLGDMLFTGHKIINKIHQHIED